MPLRRESISQRKIEAYPKWRRICYQFVSHQRFEYAIGTAISLNFLLIVVEADLGARCDSIDSPAECIPSWIGTLGTALLILYTFEAALRIFALRLQYFRDPWKLFDFFILCAGYIELLISALMDMERGSVFQMLRIFRLARLARIGRLLEFAPELKNMVAGFFSAMSAMLWGFVLIAIMLLIWSVLAVELVYETAQIAHEQNSKCHEVFGSIPSAFMWFFQSMVAGDSFGACAIPIINEQPWSLIIFASALITIQLGFTNLILAVIVERASESREANIQDKAKQIQLEKEQAAVSFADMCSDMDLDSSGKISLTELTSAFEQIPEFRACLISLGIDQIKLKKLFGLVDTDGSGDISFEELADFMHSSQKDDLKQQMMVLSLRVEDIWRRIRHGVEASVSNLVTEVRRNSLIERRMLLSKLDPSQLLHDQVVVEETKNTFDERPHQILKSVLANTVLRDDTSIAEHTDTRPSKHLLPSALVTIQQQFENNLKNAQLLLSSSLALHAQFEKEVVILVENSAESREEKEEFAVMACALQDRPGSRPTEVAEI